MERHTLPVLNAIASSKRSTNGICNEANLIGGENVGGADAPGTDSAASSDDDDGSDGDPDPDRRKEKNRKVRRSDSYYVISEKSKRRDGAVEGKDQTMSNRFALATATPVASPTLPAEGYVKLPQIIGNPKSVPPIPPVFPVSRSTWLAGVKSGRFPKPVKLGPRCTAWRVEDIRNLIQNAG